MIDIELSQIALSYTHLMFNLNLTYLLLNFMPGDVR